MQNKRIRNIEIFEDSVELMNENTVLQRCIEASITNQRVYLETEAAAVSVPHKKKKNVETVISQKRSFEAASKYARAGKKVCVLNFASAVNPGGGVTQGASAQEECLCRCSTLYPCLNIEEIWKKFYGPHRAAGNPLYNDDCLYTPGVVVFKSDVSFPERMEEQDWYQVDVLTCAAPNLREAMVEFVNSDTMKKSGKFENGRLYQLFSQRIERIFRIAAVNGAEILVLGAFGCGAFCNPPETVARVFRDVQKKYDPYFETIEYAVFCSEYDIKNYTAFYRVFKEQKKENIFSGLVKKIHNGC